MGNQEKTKKKFYKKWWFWLIIIIFLIIIFSNDSEPEKINNNQSEPESVSNEQEEMNLEKNNKETDQKSFSIGDQVKLEDIVLTVNKVEYSEGGQYHQPSQGNKWVNLNITIENLASSQQYITTMGQMFLRDKDGNSYQVSSTQKTIENINSRLDGQLIANSKRTGWVGFEVLEDAENLQFQYNASMFDEDAILVNLDK